MSLQLNPFAVSGLLISITYLPLFIFLIIKGKTKLSRIFSLHVLAVFTWGFGIFLNSLTTNENVSLNLLKVAYIGVIFIPVFLEHAVLLLLEKRNKIIIILIYLQALFFVYTNLSDKMFSLYYAFDSFYYYKGNTIFFYSFISWILIVSLAHTQLLTHYRKGRQELKKNILFIFMAIIGFVGGVTNYLPVFEIPIYPYGNFLVPIHSIFITYAILKHQLFSITIVFRRSVVYTTLIALISIFYLIIILIFEKLLQGLVGYDSSFISVLTAFLLGILFLPLRNKVQYFTDRYFFKGTHEEIVRQNEQLRQEIVKAAKYESLSTLSSGIAHEIKNPLTSLKTFTEYLPKKLDDKNFLLKFSKIVGTQVDRINDLVHQLMDYGKPAPPSFQNTDIHKLLNDTIDFFNSKLLEKKIKVVKHFNAPRAQNLYIDSNQIRQALVNIIINAIDAVAKEGQIEISTQLNKKFFQARIKDNGKGMTKSALSQIFDPFYTNKDHGTGLGLSITQSIVESHKGKIKANSQVDIGTEFIIELPLKGQF